MTQPFDGKETRTHEGSPKKENLQNFEPAKELRGLVDDVATLISTYTESATIKKVEVASWVEKAKQRAFFIFIGVIIFVVLVAICLVTLVLGVIFLVADMLTGGIGSASVLIGLLLLLALLGGTGFFLYLQRKAFYLYVFRELVLKRGKNKLIKKWSGRVKSGK